MVDLFHIYEHELDYVNFLKEINKLTKTQNKSAKVLIEELKNSPFPQIKPIESDLLVEEGNEEDIQRLENLLKLVKQVGEESYRLVKDSINNPYFEQASIEFDEKELTASKSTWRSITGTSGWRRWSIRVKEVGVYIDFCEKKDKVLVEVVRLDIEKSLQDVNNNLTQIGADCEKAIASINNINFDEIEKTVILEKTVFSNLFN